jgi:PAT family beta-lactamase induction signal transducer AmpG
MLHFTDLVKLMPSFRLLCVVILGFSSGLPLALTGTTLQAWLTVEGVDYKTIGLFALMGAPYTYKFLWSSFLDETNPGPLDKRRSWIAWSQIACALLIAALAFANPQSTGTMAWLAIAIATTSATQDMAVDAYRVLLLEDKERGLGAASYVTGYRVAMLCSGGLALVLADTWLGWRGTYLLMAGGLALCAVVTWLAPAIDGPKTSVENLDITNNSNDTQTKRRIGTALKAALQQFFTRPGALWLLVLIVAYKMGDAFAGSLTTSFLLRGLSFTLTEVGSINKTVSLVATLTGAFAGGWLMKRIGLYPALLWFGVLQGVSNLCFWGLSVSPPWVVTMAGAIAIENLCGGMGTAAFVGLLTALCHKEFSATQYALLSSLAAVGRVYLSTSAGFVVASWGWSEFFLISTALAVPGLIMLVVLREHIKRLQ